MIKFEIKKKSVEEDEEEIPLKLELTENEDGCIRVMAEDKTGRRFTLLVFTQMGTFRRVWLPEDLGFKLDRKNLISYGRE